MLSENSSERCDETYGEENAEALHSLGTDAYDVGGILEQMKDLQRIKETYRNEEIVEIRSRIHRANEEA